MVQIVNEFAKTSGQFMVIYTMENSVALFLLARIQINIEEKLQEFLLISTKKRLGGGIHAFLYEIPLRFWCCKEIFISQNSWQH